MKKPLQKTHFGKTLLNTSQQISIPPENTQ